MHGLNWAAFKSWNFGTELWTSEASGDKTHKSSRVDISQDSWKARVMSAIMTRDHGNSRDVDARASAGMVRMNVGKYNAKWNIVHSRMSVNTKMEHRTLAWVLVISGTRVHLSESMSRKDSEWKMF